MRKLALYVLPFALSLFMACNKSGKTNEGDGSTDKKHIETPDKPVDGGGDGESDAGAEEAVKAVLEKLMASCKAGNVTESAAMMAYDGGGEDAFKRHLEAVNEGDMGIAEKNCAKFESMLDGDPKVNYKRFITEKEREGTWYVWLTELNYEDGRSQEVAFAFLKIDGVFVLGDID